MGFGIKRINIAKEIPSIELLRGVASAMVCFFHLTNGNVHFLPENNMMRQVGKYGWTGVEVFFVISGFVIPYAMYVKNYTTNGLFTFLKKRIIRIEPPYLISIVLVLLLNFVSTLSPYYRGAPFTIDWANLAGHVAYLNVFTGENWLNPVYWSLGIEFQYYLLIALAYSFLAGKQFIGRLLFFAVFTGLSFLPLPEGRFFFTYAGYFLAGILLFQWVCGIIANREFFILGGFTGLLLWYQHGLGLMLLVMATLFVIIYINQVPKIFRSLGLISYSLYLIHVPIGGRITNLVETRISNIFIRECVIVIAFLVCVGVSILFYKYIEQYFKRLSGSIRYQSGAAPVSPVVAER